jgi:hypothetical protein
VIKTVRYLPAARAKAGGCRLGRLSVRTNDDREIGKLLGFVIDTTTHKIRSMVLEAPQSTVELPMGSVQFHAVSRSLRVMQGEVEAREFPAESVPHVSVEDLWVPLFDSAA